MNRAALCYRQSRDESNDCSHASTAIPAVHAARACMAGAAPESMSDARPDLQRRRVLALAALAAAATASCASLRASAARPHVALVGAGFGGATAAKYLAQWSAGHVDVTLVEASAEFISCPLSNLVLGGTLAMAQITRGYAGLAARGVRLVHGRATRVDTAARSIALATGETIGYDRLVLAPGIDFLWNRVEGLDTDASRAAFPHAWKAGPQTELLRARLVAMRDGGVFAIAIPRVPFRCPPAPYERACLVAAYLQREKPRSKVVILDANEDVQSKKALFMRAWEERYRGMVEYRHDYVLTGVDAGTGTARFETEADERFDVLNVIPPQAAGAIAHAAGVVTANGQWCEVDFRTFESIAVPRVHVLGDAIQVAPQMPKSGHMANQHGKVVAAAVLNALAGRPPFDPSTLDNTCYSFLTPDEAVHISSVHRYDPAAATYLPVAAGASLSSRMSVDEGERAHAWAQAIWQDMLG